MIGVHWKARRVQLLAWPVGLLLVCVATARAIAQFYSTPTERLAYAAALEVAPFTKAISGSGTGLDSLGGVLANEFAILLLNGLAVCGVLLAVNLTRKEEDLGRTELLTAQPIGKLTPLTSAMIAVLISMSILIAGLGATLAYYGEFNALYLLSVLAYGLVFAGIGFCCAELFGDTRHAMIVGLGIYFVSYFIRIAVIATASRLWWASPLGWFDHVEPFAAQRWLPLVMLIAFSLALHIVALVLRMRRDLGTGLVSFDRQRRGSTALLGFFPLKLCLTLICSWVAVSLAFGVLMGSMLDQWVDVLTLNLDSVEAFGFSGTTDSISYMIGLLAASFSAAAGIGVVSAAHKEETSTRMSYLLSNPLSRSRYWAQWMAVAIGATVIVHLVITGAYVVTGQLDAFVPLLSYLAPALFLVGFAAATHIYAGWALYALAVIMAFFADTINISADYFPINSIHKVPAEDLNITAILILSILALILIAASFVRFTSRSING